MGKLGFYFDMGRCIGCKSCQVACKDKNNLAAGSFYRRADFFATQGTNVLFGYSGTCGHCQNPECVAACPTGAMHKTDCGATGHDRHKCIGCGCCIWGCPLGATSFSKQSGQSQKCNSCVDLRESGRQPACVAACVSNCLAFGDLDMLKEQLGGSMENAAYFLTDISLTSPKLLIKMRKGAMGAEDTMVNGETDG